jgi:hypothetical protein
MSETECFKIEIEGEEIELCTRAIEYRRLWCIDYSRYWIVKRDNEYQAHVSLGEYLEYDSLSEV